jgi:nitrite reductase/ring-hydroxylating ferredoxin subunit
MSQAICLPFSIAEITDPGSRGFSYEEHGTEIQAFVVRKASRVYAYRNQCPHTGVALNWSEDVFLNYDEQYIQCAMHGALFTLTEGYCTWGPCVGQSLQTLDIEVDNDGRILLKV